MRHDIGGVLGLPVHKQMAKVLLIFSTTDGQTRKISEFLADCLQSEGNSVEVVGLQKENNPPPKGFDKIIIGARIRYGRHHADVYSYVSRYRTELQSRPTAFFSVNVVARKPGKDLPDANPYMRKFLRKSHWRPDLLAVFAGKINYPVYKFWDRQIIRFIMWLTHGPTQADAVVEFTNWDKVREFALQFSRLPVNGSG